MTSPVLSVRDLAVSFRLDRTWQSAVSDLSFDIAAGETVTPEALDANYIRRAEFTKVGAP